MVFELNIPERLPISRLNHTKTCTWRRDTEQITMQNGEPSIPRSYIYTLELYYIEWCIWHQLTAVSLYPILRSPPLNDGAVTGDGGSMKKASPLRTATTHPSHTPHSLHSPSLNTTLSYSLPFPRSLHPPHSPPLSHFLIPSLNHSLNPSILPSDNPCLPFPTPSLRPIHPRSPRLVSPFSRATPATSARRINKPTQTHTVRALSAVR